MAKKKKEFKVVLFASLPASAVMTVEADTPEEAKQWAFEHSHLFPWDGADYERPGRAEVTDAEVL